MKNWIIVFCDLEKSMEYFASAVIAVSSNPCVRPTPRTKISFLLLSIWTGELLCTPKITKFLLQSKFGTWKSELESRPISYQE